MNDNGQVLRISVKKRIFKILFHIFILLCGTIAIKRKKIPRLSVEFPQTFGPVTERTF
jgi:hypothetical protein